jgi:signal peptidase II
MFMTVQNKSPWIFSALFIAVEQFIKVIINCFYLNENAAILSPWLYFKPVFNRDYSWINSIFHFGISKWIHITVNGFILIILLLFYRYITQQICKNKTINISFVFILSGIICSILDKVIWNGSLDYIYVKGFFTFDLKDVYIDIFIAFVLIQMIFRTQTMASFNKRNVLKGFYNYYFHKT